MGWKFATCDRKDVEDRNLVASRDFFKTLVEAFDLTLVLGTHRKRNTWSGRDVGNVRHDNRCACLLFQRTQNLIVVFRKLFDRETVTDVVDTDPQRHKIRRPLHAALQLRSQYVVRRRTANAKIHEFRSTTMLQQPSKQTGNVAAIPSTHTGTSRIP